MEKTLLNNLISRLRVCIVAFIVSIISLVLFSFTVDKINEDLFKQLGVTKTEADKKIAASLLGGYLDTYGTKNIKNIAQSNRTAIAKDLLTYTKQYSNTAAFKNEYASLKETNKPTPTRVQTPAEMQQSTIAKFKKSVADMEASIKRADANTKPILEKVLICIKKQFKEAEDPNHNTNVRYAKNFPQAVKDNEAHNNLLLRNWEEKYPASHLVFIKQHLERFLEETNEIDFAAALTSKNGKKIFVNSAYEKQKGTYWKMAFRAGREVVEPARAFVQQWISEIK